MIHPPLASAATTDKIVSVIQHFEDDEFETFLTNDAELRMAYDACMRAADLEWSDEALAEATFRRLYGDKVDDLMQAWRWQRALRDPADPEHGSAINVHIAVAKWQHKQKKG